MASLIEFERPLKQPFFVGEYILDDLLPFWEKEGLLLQQSMMQLPDFSNPDWGYQMLPSGHGDREFQYVQGPVVPLQYYRMEQRSSLVQRFVLSSLIENAAVAGYSVILEIGPSDTLNPVTTAGTFDRTIVIAIDSRNTSQKSYPTDSYHVGYPYVANIISRMAFRSSAAFFFEFPVESDVVQSLLRDAVYRAQIIAVEGSYVDYKFARLIRKIGNTVSPGGELVIVGDTSSTSDQMLTCHPSQKITQRELDALFTEFPSVSRANLDAITIGNQYGIWDSKHTIPAYNLITNSRPAFPGFVRLTGKS